MGEADESDGGGSFVDDERAGGAALVVRIGDIGFHGIAARIHGRGGRAIVGDGHRQTGRIGGDGDSFRAAVVGLSQIAQGDSRRGGCHGDAGGVGKAAGAGGDDVRAAGGGGAEETGGIDGAATAGGPGEGRRLTGHRNAELIEQDRAEGLGRADGKRGRGRTDDETGGGLQHPHIHRAGGGEPLAVANRDRDLIVAGGFKAGAGVLRGVAGVGREKDRIARTAGDRPSVCQGGLAAVVGGGHRQVGRRAADDLIDGGVQVGLGFRGGGGGRGGDGRGLVREVTAG